MAGALLGRAFDLTAEARYVDLLAQFILDGEIQQDSGLFWHCRPAPFYWGRGNGFALMGLTETLTYLPEDHASRADIMDMYLDLLDALGESQRQSGMLPQVLDFPGSYDEFTATCMMGYSVARDYAGDGWTTDGAHRWASHGRACRSASTTSATSLTPAQVQECSRTSGITSTAQPFTVSTTAAEEWPSGSLWRWSAWRGAFEIQHIDP